MGFDVWDNKEKINIQKPNTVSFKNLPERQKDEILMRKRRPFFKLLVKSLKKKAVY